MASRSEQIRERLFECIHKSELDNDDLVKIVEHITNHINNYEQSNSTIPQSS